MPTVPYIPTQSQVFRFGSDSKIIVRPLVGSTLLRMEYLTGRVTWYVVTRVRYRSTRSRKNANLVDCVVCHEIDWSISFIPQYNPTPILNYLTADNQTAVIGYRESSPLILTLTNHGDWWPSQLAAAYSFTWNVLPVN